MVEEGRSPFLDSLIGEASLEGDALRALRKAGFRVQGKQVGLETVRLKTVPFTGSFQMTGELLGESRDRKLSFLS